MKITTVSYTFEHYFYDILILEELKQALKKSGNHEGDDAGVGHLDELDNEIDLVEREFELRVDLFAAIFCLALLPGALVEVAEKQLLAANDWVVWSPLVIAMTAC